MAPKRKDMVKDTSAQQMKAKKAKKDPMTEKFEEIARATDILPLADDVKKMIADVLPCSLGEFSDQRSTFQQRVVESVAGILGEVEASLKAAVEAARTQCSEATAKKPEHEREVTEAAAKLDASKTETQRLKVALADAAFAFRAATDVLAEAEKTKKLDAQAAQDAEKKKGQLEGALATLKALSAALPEGDDVQKKPDDLVSFLSKQKFEESILIALPVALSKAPETRGQFDNIAITQIENDIRKRIAEQDEILSAAKPGQEKCEAAVQDATHCLQEAREAQLAAAKNFNAASLEQAACEELSAKAMAALRDITDSSKRLEKAVYAAEAEVELFEQGPMETFKALRTRVTPPAAVEEVEEPAMDEAVEAAEVEMPKVEMPEAQAEVPAIGGC